MAWHYKQYSKDEAIAKAEKEAKEGLWANAKVFKALRKLREHLQLMSVEQLQKSEAVALS